MDKEILLEAYERMLLVRRTEEEIARYFYDNKVMSFIHLSIGQEACSVGVCENLEIKDLIYLTHRGHSGYISKGGCIKKLFAELLAKKGGFAGGNGGSMHCIDRSVGLNGSSPLLGAITPIAVGSAFAQKFKGENNISCVFTGDGSSEQGVFHESVNLAATMNLPVLFVIENNLYSVMTYLEDRRSANRDNKKLYEGLGAHYMSLNGNDFVDVYENSKVAIKDLKNGSRPYVLELHCHRKKAHSSPMDNFAFRKKDTKEVMEKEDCVKRMQEYLKEVDLSEINDRVEKQVREAIEFGVNSPEPTKDELGKYLYA